VAKDLAAKLQTLLGAFSLDLDQKNVDFLADHPVPDIRLGGGTTLWDSCKRTPQNAYT